MKIEISNLRKTFGSTVACDIPELHVNDGETIGLVGNNGAGKTTLFRMMLDLQKADSGSITLTPKGGSAINVAESEDWKSHTGAYIDEGFLIDFLTPEEYFAFLAKTAGISAEETTSRLECFAPFTGGEVFGKNVLIRNLSAGNKQKVGIISAFFRQTELVVLDEPFNFLDPTSQNLLKKTIAEYSHDTGATVIVSSHNLTHTVDVSTRIVLLEHGKVVRDIPNNGEGDVETELNDYFKA
jgi:ABC-2 type transport system ATP-binding protein